MTLEEKRTLEVLLQMEDGWVLNFTNRDLYHFFEELGVDIYQNRGDYYSLLYGYKSNKYAKEADNVFNFFLHGNNKLVGETIFKFIEYIKHEIDLGKLIKKDFPEKRIVDAQNIAHRLLGKPPVEIKNPPQTVFSDNTTDIILHEDIFRGVQELLNNEHYSNAVWNSYMIFLGKLKDITGYERGTDASSKKNLEKIWGYTKEEIEQDNFLQGVRFLLMAIQHFRNGKAHSPPQKIEKNLALHYIALASLAYKLLLSVDMHAPNKKQSYTK